MMGGLDMALSRIVVFRSGGRGALEMPLTRISLGARLRAWLRTRSGAPLEAALEMAPSRLLSLGTTRHGSSVNVVALDRKMLSEPTEEGGAFVEGAFEATVLRPFCTSLSLDALDNRVKARLSTSYDDHLAGRTGSAQRSFSSVFRIWPVMILTMRAKSSACSGAIQSTSGRVHCECKRLWEWDTRYSPWCFRNR